MWLSTVVGEAGIVDRQGILELRKRNDGHCRPCSFYVTSCFKGPTALVWVPGYARSERIGVISLLDSISKLFERTAAHLIADHLERRNRLHDGQYGCRKRRWAVGAVAVLMNQAWKGKKVAGAPPMDVKSAFTNVSRPF